jgi:UDP-N-acetylmuramyl pentapeptide phosphotransferase/UDP-N-acetylglucosamine-1-phosphate transferase
LPIAYLAPPIAFTLSLGATVWLLRGRRLQILDHPNERSLHAAPVPRTGGLGLFAGIVVGWLIAAPPDAWLILAGALVLAGVSFFDDLRGLPVLVRLSIQLAVSVALVAWHWDTFTGAAWAVAAVLAIAWMCNLYNFMDGADGLAGGMAAFGFGAYAIAAGLGGALELAALCAAITASALAFLAYNFPPARIFMGDVGSVPLGFLAAALGMLGWQQGLWPVWFPVLVFSPFVVDATVTLLRRALRGERVWQAHKEHYYQRVVQLGAGHRGTALGEYALMMAAGASALGLMAAPAPLQWAGLGAWVIFYAAVMLWIDHLWRSR